MLGQGRITSASLWMVLDRGARLLITTAVLVLVARYLGPHALGTLAFASALVTIASVIASGGSDEIVVSRLGVHGDSHQTFASALRLRLLGSGIACGGVILAAVMLRPDDREFQLIATIVSFSLPLLAADVIELRFRALLQPRATAIARTLALGTGAAIRVVLVIVEAPLVAFAWALVIEAGLAALALVIVHQRSRLQPSPDDPACSVRELLVAAWPLAAASLAVTACMRIDQIMLGSMLGDREVGLYGAAIKIVEVTYIGPMAISATALGVLARIRLTDETGYRHLLKLTAQATVWGSIIAAAALAVAADPIITLPFGTAFAEAGPLLRILCWNVPLVAIGLVLGRAWVVESRQRTYLCFVVAGLVVNLVLNVILIPRHGPSGAAVATLLSQAVIVLIAPAMHPACRTAVTAVWTWLWPRELVAYLRGSRWRP